jgi:hypothetical protein
VTGVRFESYQAQYETRFARNDSERQPGLAVLFNKRVKAIDARPQHNRRDVGGIGIAVIETEPCPSPC